MSESLLVSSALRIHAGRIRGHASVGDAGKFEVLFWPGQDSPSGKFSLLVCACQRSTCARTTFLLYVDLLFIL